MRLIAPYARPRLQKFMVGLTLLVSGSVTPIVGTRFARRVSYRARPSLPRLASPRDITPHRRAVRRNDFNEAASITSVNRARALTGDLRPVGRAYTSIQRERHRVPPREAIDKVRLTSIHSAASGDCQGDYQEMMRRRDAAAFLHFSERSGKRKKNWMESKKQNPKLETLYISTLLYID